MSDFILSAALELRDNFTGKIKSAARGLSSVRSMAGSASSSIDRATSSMEQAGASAGRLGQRLSRISGNYTANVTARDMATPTINRVRTGLSSLGSRATSPVVRLRDEATNRIARIRQKLSGLTGKAYTAVVNVKQNMAAQGGPLGKTMSGMSNAASGMLMGADVQMMGTAGIGYGIYDTINTYKNFDKQMATVKALSTSDMDTEEAAAAMDRLTKKAREMGAATQFSATEAAKAFEYMGMAGWNVEQMISGIPSVLNLALASGEDLASVSDIVTDAMTTLKIDTRGANADKNIQQFTDVLAAAATHSNTNVGMMGEAFKYAAAPAGFFTKSYENAADVSNDVALALGLMANSGIKASQAGTALRSTLTLMTADTIPTANAMSMLGVNILQTGKDGTEQLKPLRAIFDDLRAKMKEGVSAESLVNYAEALSGTKTRNKDVLIAFANKLAEQGGKLSAKDQAKFAKMFAGEEALSGWLSIMTATDQDYQDLIKAIDNSEGSAAKMAATRADTLAGDFDILKSAWEDLQIEFMTGKGSDGLREFLQGAQKDINKFKEYIKDGFDISDVGKIILDIITQLKDKFLKLDGVGSILAGGALLAGLYKISSKAISVADTLKNLVKSPASVIGGKGATPTSIPDLASNVNSMVVNARSVIVNGSVGGGNSGGADIGDFMPDTHSGGKGKGGAARGGSGRGVQGRARAGTMPRGANAGNMGRFARVSKWMGRLAVPLAVAAGAWGAYSVSQENDVQSQAAQERVNAANANLEKLRTQSVGEAAASVMSNKDIMASLSGAGLSSAEMTAAVAEQQAAIDNQKAVERENTNRMGASVGGTGGALVGGLAGMKAGAAAGGAIGTFFGGPVGTAAGAAIGGAIGGIGGAFAGSELGQMVGGQAAEIGEYFSGAWESVKAEVANTAEWVGNQFDDMVSVVGEKLSGIKDAAQNEWDYVKNTASEAMQGIEDKWNGVSSWMDANVWTLFKDAGITAINFVVGLGSLAGDAIGEAISPVVSYLDENVWTPVKEFAGNTWDAIKTEASEDWEAVKNGFSDFSSWIDMTVWQPVKETAGAAWQEISSFPSVAAEMAGTAWETVSTWFDGAVWQPLSSGASMAWDTVSMTAGAAWDAIIAYFAPAAAWFDSTVWQPISSAVSGVQSAISGAFEAAWSAVTGIWSAAGAWFESNVIAPVKAAFNKITSIGASITGLRTSAEIGGNAIGTSYFKGGWTEINEHGGEIVDLPQGSRIYPHATTLKMLQDEISPAAQAAESVSGGRNVADIIGSNFSQIMQQVSGVFSPKVSGQAEMLAGMAEDGQTSGNTSAQGQPSQGMPSVNISGNEFVIREDADIGRIAFELFRLFRQSAGNYQFTGAGA